MKRFRELEKDNVGSDIAICKELWDIILWHANPIKTKIDNDLGLSFQDRIELYTYIVYFKRISKSFSLLFNEIMKEWFIRIFYAVLGNHYRRDDFTQKLKDSPQKTLELAKRYVLNEMEIMKLKYLQDKNYYIICQFHVNK